MKILMSQMKSKPFDTMFCIFDGYHGIYWQPLINEWKANSDGCWSKDLASLIRIFNLYYDNKLCNTEITMHISDISGY